MKTISDRKFLGNFDHYLDMARQHDEVRVKKGREAFRIIYEPACTPQPILEPDDRLRRAISMDEFKERMLARIDKLDDKYGLK